MLITESANLMLRVTSSGTLLPWIGPALRGLVAGRLKAHVCQHPRNERETQWQHCHGCPHQSTCAYARLYEPATENRDNLSEATRPIVLAPFYPTPQHVEPGMQFPLRIAIAGQVESYAYGILLEAIEDAGRKPGIGPDKVTFEVLAGEQHQLDFAPDHLPAKPDAIPGSIPRLGVGLVSPLFLSHRTRTANGSRGRRQENGCPKLVDFFRASARMLTQLFEQQGDVIDHDIASLDQAAASVETIDHCFESFHQPKWSSRGKQRYDLKGVVGGGVYQNVPLALLPWLLWGGRLYSSSHRVAGGGGWRIVMD